MTFIQALNNETTRDLIEGIEDWADKAEAGCKIANQCHDSLIAELAAFGYTYED